MAAGRSTEVALSYTIPRRGNVIISALDMSGRRVPVVVDREHGPGSYRLTWEPGRDLVASTPLVFTMAADNQVHARVVAVPGR